jgi:aspartate aminotransferase
MLPHHNVSRRIAPLQQSLAGLMRLLNTPIFANRGQDPDRCDFMFGNPHEMPLPDLVDALQRWVAPQENDWYAHKMNEYGARQAVVDDLYQWRGARHFVEDIFLTNGGFAALSVTLNALVDPGEEVVFISPPWIFYEPIVLSAGGVPAPVRIDPHTFDLDLGAIEAALTEKTRAIIVNSPHNPTGKMYTEATLQGLADVLNRAQNRTQRPIYLLSDEAYSRLVFDGRRYLSPTAFYPRSILLYTYSKVLLAPGQRIGYIALHPEMPYRDQVRHAILISQMITGHAFPNALMQHALPELNRASIDVAHLQRKRDFMVNSLREVGYEVHCPDGTFFMVARSPLEDDVTFTVLLAQRKIYCLPGRVIEMPGYFRISLTANDAMIDRAIPGFAAVLRMVRSL